MVKENIPEPDKTGEIPAWFMTYSDVITLLMTFFILLLTFATTEPDSYDRIQQTIFAGANGSGLVGPPISGSEKDSFVQRTRPRAARMAMVGSEMPPYQVETSTKSVGAGIKGLSQDEASKDVMTTHQFELPIKSIVSSEKHITSRGMHVAGMLAGQLRRFPVDVSLQCSSAESFEQTTAFLIHLYQTERIRPGQVGISIVDNVAPSHVRFSIERFGK